MSYSYIEGEEVIFSIPGTEDRAFIGTVFKSMSSNMLIPVHIPVERYAIMREYFEHTDSNRIMVNGVDSFIVYLETAQLSKGVEIATKLIDDTVKNLSRI